MEQTAILMKTPWWGAWSSRPSMSELVEEDVEVLSKRFLHKKIPVKHETSPNLYSSYNFHHQVLEMKLKEVAVCLCCVMMAMENTSWVSATCRAAFHIGHDLHQPGPSQSPQPSQQLFLDSKQNSNGIEGMSEEAYYRGWGKLGSNPPSCKYKCYGCIPCVAIQVPTTTTRMGVQYTNYEPEGWKCQCGPAFFSP